MPWWIWLLLVVFMLVMIIAGVAYAVFRLWKGLQKISNTGSQIGERITAMSQPYESQEADEPAIFTQPLSVASDRYVQAHAEVVRREEAKRSRHVEAWSRWRKFND